MKTCSRCKVEKPKTEFTKMSRSKDKLQINCKSCKREQAKICYHKKPEHYKRKSNNWIKKNPEKNKHYSLKAAFNLTIEEYNELLIKQNYKCIICERHQNEFKLKLAVDHCHKSGKIRGLLCGGCNTSLGNMKDNVFWLQNAINYLIKET